MTQVVIVGAGPTGATLVLLLVKRGIPVKLVEAARDFRRLFRGEALMPSGLEALGHMDLLPMLERIPHRALDAWEFMLGGRSLFRVDEPIEKQGLPCTLVSQPDLLAAIIEQASKAEQFEFLPGKPVQDLLRDRGRVTGVKLADGQEITAQIVIGADGRNSLIRQRAGLYLEQQSHPIDILWFQLPAGSLARSENVFCSILKDQAGFGVFVSSQGNLQIGWGLHRDERMNWQQIDWAQRLIDHSPPWLAQHIQTHRETLPRPMLLSVIVGLCQQWWQPGLLLLGDAVHPMSPIRAQGINMALRDVIVAANYLVPLLRDGANSDAIDAVLPSIQCDRKPEIIRIQQLQRAELNQGEKLRNSALLRWLVREFIPLLRPFIVQSWLQRQQQLRQGVIPF